MVLFSYLEDIGSFTGPSDVTVMTNATVSLSCRAGHCVPISFSAWVNNNVNFAAFQSILRNDAKYDNFDINSTDRCIGQMDLLVTNAQPEDAGIYTCQINGDIQEATLNVEGKNSFKLVIYFLGLIFVQIRALSL